MPLQIPGRLLARFLSKRRPSSGRTATSSSERLQTALRKGDVLLVEGDSRISAAIKYLTQSTWSHAALYIGDALGAPTEGDEALLLAEADVNDGVRAVPLNTYAGYHTRICRPVGLSPEEIDTVIEYVVSRLGYKYDLKNVFDLARYLIQQPPVPNRWKRQLLAFGSGDPTRAICSSLIAQAFQSVQYPILPETVGGISSDPACTECREEILHIRHHSLFAPRDFDISPYFQVVKPLIEGEFDFHQLVWEAPSTE